MVLAVKLFDSAPAQADHLASDDEKVVLQNEFPDLVGMVWHSDQI